MWVLFLFPCSGIIRVAQHFLHFRHLSLALGQHYENKMLSCFASESQCLLAVRIGRVVELTARYTPWRCQCLVQANMARILLGLYSIPYILHIGVSSRHSSENLFKAHAWVKVGPWVIVGAGSIQDYTLISSWIPPNWDIDSEN
jgi:hypothetical protein